MHLQSCTPIQFFLVPDKILRDVVSCSLSQKTRGVSSSAELLEDEMFRVRRSALRDVGAEIIILLLVFFAVRCCAYAPSHLLFVTRLPCFPPVEIASTFIIHNNKHTQQSSSAPEKLYFIQRAG